MVTKQPNTTAGSDTPSVLQPDPEPAAADVSSAQAPQITEHPIDLGGAATPADVSSAAQPAVQPESTPSSAAQPQPQTSVSITAEAPASVESKPALGNVDSVVSNAAPKASASATTTPLGTPMPTTAPTEPEKTTSLDAGLGGVVSTSAAVAASPSVPNPQSPAANPADVLTNAAGTSASAPTLTSQPLGGEVNQAGQPAPNASAPAAAANEVTTSPDGTNQTAANGDKNALEEQAKQMVKDLDKETKEMQKDKPKEKKPKRKGGGKSKAMAAAGMMLFLLVGLGTFAGLRLIGTEQDGRSQAGGIGQGPACVSNRGLKIISSTSPGSAGDLNYTPAQANNMAQSYNVANGDEVNFRVRVENTGNAVINDSFFFTTHKVLEAPVGEAVDATSALGEAELFDIHGDGSGTRQQLVHNSGLQQYSVQPGEQKYLNVPAWKPTNDQCGLYQIDLSVNEFADVCSDNTLAAAGFIRVVGCGQQLSCNDACTNDAECEEADSNYFCATSLNWTSWQDVSGNVSDSRVSGSSGALASLHTFDEGGVRKQHLVKGGRIWYRENDGSWTAWENRTSNVSSVGSGTITSFTVLLEGDVKTQHMVRGGKVWRIVRGGGQNTDWEDVTSNVSGVGSGTITSFSSYINTTQGGMKQQHLVRGGRIYSRNDLAGWNKWEEVTGNVGNVGSGAVKSLMVKMVDGKVNQHLVKGSKMWTREGSENGRACRLKANPESTTCGPQVECARSCESETTSGWDECNYCDQKNFSSAECLQREVQCRERAVARVGIGESEYPAPINGTSRTDRILWFNWGQAQESNPQRTRISCGTACGMGAVCCVPPGEPTKPPTQPPTQPPTVPPTNPPSALACLEQTPKSVSLSLGQEQEFECAGDPANRAEYANFQYKIDTGAWESMTATGSSQLAARLTVTQAGSYQVRCQVCEGQGASATCTNWQNL